MCKNLIVTFGLFVNLIGLSQHSPAPTITANPDDAIIVTKDIDNFWKAFDALNNYNGNPFDDLYIKNGSQGVKSFLDHNRIVNADTLKLTVIKRKQACLNIRKNSLAAEFTEKQCRFSYYAPKF